MIPAFEGWYIVLMHMHIWMVHTCTNKPFHVQVAYVPYWIFSLLPMQQSMCTELRALSFRRVKSSPWVTLSKSSSSPITSPTPASVVPVRSSVWERTSPGSITTGTPAPSTARTLWETRFSGSTGRSSFDELKKLWNYSAFYNKYKTSKKNCSKKAKNNTYALHFIRFSDICILHFA
jgi:hypothetical protein